MNSTSEQAGVLLVLVSLAIATEAVAAGIEDAETRVHMLPIGEKLVAPLSG